MTEQVGALALRVQAVITLRSLGFMGLWTLHPGEACRMWSEKPTAFAASGLAVTMMAATGRPADDIMRAALDPFLDRTGQNLERLRDRPRLSQDTPPSV